MVLYNTHPQYILLPLCLYNYAIPSKSFQSVQTPTNLYFQRLRPDLMLCLDLVKECLSVEDWKCGTSLRYTITYSLGLSAFYDHHVQASIKFAIKYSSRRSTDNWYYHFLGFLYTNRKYPMNVADKEERVFRDKHIGQLYRKPVKGKNRCESGIVKKLILWWV